MSGERLLYALQGLQDAYIQEAEFDKITRARRIPRRTLLLAAALTIAALLVGCAIVYALHAENLQIDRAGYAKPVYDEQGNVQSYEDATGAVLTLSGLKGTPGYQAAKEWQEFISGYDPDGTILAASFEDEQEFDSRYDAFAIYSQEMADKVDEIAGRYELKLPGAALQTLGQKALLRLASLDGILLQGSETEAELSNGVIYENGNYVQPFRLRMPEAEDGWPYWSDGVLYLFRKDSFCTQMALLEDTGDWQEWSYRTASGGQVLLLLSPSSDEAWMFCDRVEYFQSIRLNAIHTLYENEGTEEQRIVRTEQLTATQLEYFADQLDFAMEPVRIDASTDLLDTGIDSSQMLQAHGGWSVEMLSAVTDTRTAYITLKVKAPDGTDLSTLPNTAVIGFRQTSRLLRSEGFSEALMEKWAWELSGENTLFLTQEINLNLFNGERPYLPEEPWELYLEDLYATAPNMDTDQVETLWTAEGCWQFALPFGGSGSRLIEMLNEPITVQAAVYEEETGEYSSVPVTLVSFHLRSFGATLTFDGQGGDICSWDSPVYVVLDDGTEIPLIPGSGGDSEFYLSIMGGTSDSAVPLDKVAFVRLPDGQTLDAK